MKNHSRPPFENSLSRCTRAAIHCVGGAKGGKKWKILSGKTRTKNEEQQQKNINCIFMSEQRSEDDTTEREIFSVPVRSSSLAACLLKFCNIFKYAKFMLGLTSTPYTILHSGRKKSFCCCSEDLLIFLHNFSLSPACFHL